MKKAAWKRIASKRIEQLMLRAGTVEQHLADRYVFLARRLGMRFKVRFERVLKRRFCKHCYAFLRPGVNARVRTQRGRVIITCFSCKKFTRIPIRPVRGAQASVRVYRRKERPRSAQKIR